ncbi:MAG: sigma-54-dependent Fis family transcriptional regulator, partial [bacterium]
MTSKILVVDDEKKICSILSQILSEEGYAIQTVGSGESAIEVVDSFRPDLILMDQNMPGMNGIETMVEIKNRHPEITVIILTAFGSIPLAVEAIKKGAYDYLSKPFDNDELLILAQRALEHHRLTEEVSQLKKQLQEKFSFTNIIGVSPKMQQVFEQINRVCATDATVLIQGESGTGKELIMKAIHFHSHRKDKPLVTVNCGAVPVNLLESEFFGHEKGAFTDAKERKIGKFEQAQGGTIFLDEVGELPHDAQVKLLRVLDDRKLTRIGGNQTIPLDVRVIAATNKNLAEEVKKEKFRLDLFYRLNIVTMNVPPLRERKEDIPLLVEHFMEKYNKRLRMQVKSVSKSAMSYLKDYPWHGNVRDLENAIQSAMILAQ